MLDGSSSLISMLVSNVTDAGSCPVWIHTSGWPFGSPNIKRVSGKASSPDKGTEKPQGQGLQACSHTLPGFLFWLHRTQPRVSLVDPAPLFLQGRGEGSPQSTSTASSEARRSAAWLTGSLTRHQEARLILSPPWGGRQTSSDRPLKCKVCPCLSSPQALWHFTNHAGSST